MIRFSLQFISEILLEVKLNMLNLPKFYQILKIRQVYFRTLIKGSLQVENIKTSDSEPRYHYQYEIKLGKKKRKKSISTPPPGDCLNHFQSFPKAVIKQHTFNLEF